MTTTADRLMKTHRIEFTELDSAIFGRNLKRGVRGGQRGTYGLKGLQPVKGPEPLEFSVIELAIYTALAAVTAYRQYDERVARLARSYLCIMDLLVDPQRDTISMPGGYASFFRDFSGTARKGEIAQGINYAFATEVLGASAIYDFDFFLSLANPSKRTARGSKPDYVLYYDNLASSNQPTDKWNRTCPANGSIYLLESKACTNRSVGCAMYDGHDQCVSGMQMLRNYGVTPIKSYSSAIQISTSNSGKQSAAYIADPIAQEPPAPLDLGLTPTLYEYSKWFYLAGNEDLATHLMRGESPSAESLAVIQRAGGRFGVFNLDPTSIAPNIDFNSITNGIDSQENPTGVQVVLKMDPELTEWLGAYASETDGSRKPSFPLPRRERSFDDGTTCFSNHFVIELA